MRYRGLIVAIAVPTLLLAACGESPKGNLPVPGNNGAGSPGDGASESSSEAGAAAGPVDVCSLLSDEEAVEVATNAPLVTSSSVTYTIEREKQEYSPEVFKPPLGGCKFQFYSTTDIAPKSISATVVIEARDASGFDLYKSGTPVPGLGDEAYKSTGSTVVRKGNVMLSAGENSATDDFVVAMYKPMVEKLQ